MFIGLTITHRSSLEGEPIKKVSKKLLGEHLFILIFEYIYKKICKPNKFKSIHLFIILNLTIQLKSI